MFSQLFFTLSLFSLGAIASLNIFDRALRHYHFEKSAKKTLRSYFFLIPLNRFFFKNRLYEGLLFSTSISLAFYRFLFVVSTTVTFLEQGVLVRNPIGWIGLFTALFIVLMICELFAQWIASSHPESFIKYSELPASLFLLVTSPISWSLSWLTPWAITSYRWEGELNPSGRAIVEMIQKLPISNEITIQEKKLIESVLRFKERIAREVMVPRVDLFCLAAETSIKEAVNKIEEEGYSRIPVYKESIDEMIGVLMYKDLLHVFHEYSHHPENALLLNQPIEKFIKPLLFSPETKKISNLLLEFRKKQTHLSMIVDEYGGTAGIVTIEDILEEIVGEIEDEYDVEEELFFPQKNGSWVLDARISILEVEQQLGVLIPQEGDYDTVGGYLFHCAGTIPSKGFTVHQETFQIEVLRSDERKVEKVRLTPLPQENTFQEKKAEDLT